MRLKTLSEYDTALFYRLNRLTAQRQCRRVLWMSKTGDGYLYFALGMLLWAFEREHGELFLYTALMAYGLELPVYVVMKKLFRRPRPCDLLSDMFVHVKPSDKFSLPSGHTAAAWLMASIIVYFYPDFALLACSWAMLIGLSRILLGVHYPTDVLAGMLLGIAIASASLWVMG